MLTSKMFKIEKYFLLLLALMPLSLAYVRQEAGEFKDKSLLKKIFLIENKVNFV